jgi:hypothetical protein
MIPGDAAKEAFDATAFAQLFFRQPEKALSGRTKPGQAEPSLIPQLAAA